MAVISTDTMEAHIVRAINIAAGEVRERAIQNAVADFERNLRETVLKSAIELSSFYQIERERENIIITVRSKDTTK